MLVRGQKIVTPGDRVAHRLLAGGQVASGPAPVRDLVTFDQEGIVEYCGALGVRVEEIRDKSVIVTVDGKPARKELILNDL